MTVLATGEGPRPAMGVLLVGHGSRSERGIAEYAATVELVSQRLTGFVVQPAFLELASPDIAAGMDQIAARGVQELVVAPLLLFAAGHARRDIPAAVAEGQKRHPRLRVRLAEPLHCHPQLLDLSLDRFHEAAPAGEVTDLIVVGRGSSDPEALEEAGRYAGELARRAGVARHQLAFVAVARPRLSEVLDDCNLPEGSRVVVVPHLLFSGEVLGEIQERVEAFRFRHPQVAITLARHLGPAPRLAEALVARIAEALARESLDKGNPLD